MMQKLRNLFGLYTSEWKEVRRTYTSRSIKTIYIDYINQKEMQEAIYGFTTIEYIDQKGKTKFVRVLGDQRV